MYDDFSYYNECVIYVVIECMYVCMYVCTY